MPCWQDADLCRRGVIKVHSQESSRPVFLGQREQVHSQESSRPVFLGQREQVHSQESSRPVFLGQREQPIKVWVTSCASLWSNSFHTFRSSSPKTNEGVGSQGLATESAGHL
ncbi:uncharacterized protein LOC144798280 isoform X3 [Lissotriton helveticus]